MPTLQELIDTLTERPVAFHRGFVKLTGSINAALMLSQAMYWRKRTKDQRGWFYKSQQEWEDETGMGRREQETARKKLRDSGFWEERRDRINHRIYFRVKMEAFEVMAESDITHGRNPPLPNGAISHSSNRSENTAEISSESGIEKAAIKSIKTPPKPSPNGAAPLPQLPEEWRGELSAHWDLFVKHCFEKRKPVTATQAEAIFDQWEDMTYQEIRESINLAITTGYTGLIRLRQNSPRKPQRTEPANVNL